MDSTRIFLAVTSVAWLCFCSVTGLTGSPRTARDGRSPYSAMSQTRRSRYYYFLTSRQYYYYHEQYSALQRSVVGTARYSRVYSGISKYISPYYKQYFSFTRTSAFDKYKGRIHREISICRNFEANENGSYLGVYTCPLPFEPQEYAYCCGESNAEFCCRFQDKKTNVIGAALLGTFLICPIGFLVFAVQRWCQKDARFQRSIRKRWRDAIEKVIDRDRKELEKAVVRNSAFDADAMSVFTGSVPSLQSICSSTESLRQWDTLKEDQTDQSEVSTTVEQAETGQSENVHTQKPEKTVQSEISTTSVKYTVDESEVSKFKSVKGINSLLPETQSRTFSPVSLAASSSRSVHFRPSSSVQPIEILNVIGQEGAVECRGLSRVTIHLPEAWPDHGAGHQEGSRLPENSNWTDGWF